MNARLGWVATSIALQAVGVRAQLGGIEVLHGIDLSLAAGRWISIVGPNGAGKSTLLRVLAGLQPHEGTVELFGQPVDRLNSRVRAQQLSWLGQNEAGSEDLTVYDVVMLGRRPHLPWLAAPSDSDRDAVEQALNACQAWDWRERALGHLSGGERQRVLLARAIAVQAQVLLMDEPLANLDPPHQADWLAMVRALVIGGRTVVSVLHEISMALHADDMLVMQQGLISHHGSCSSPETHRALEKVFEHRVQIWPVAGQWVVIQPTPLFGSSEPHATS